MCPCRKSRLYAVTARAIGNDATILALGNALRDELILCVNELTDLKQLQMSAGPMQDLLCGDAGDRKAGSRAKMRCLRYAFPREGWRLIPVLSTDRRHRR